MAEQINERPIGRRDFLKATTLAAAGGVLAAREPAVAASATDKPQAAQPKRGGVLRLAHLSDVIGFDPTQLPLANWPMYFALYDTLIRYDENYKPTPQLAESWDLLDGGKRLVMKLRKGVTFHSGREFTADDVLYTLKRFQTPEVGANMRTLATYIKEARADDKHAVSFFMDKPNAAILDLFDLLFIMDREREKDIKTKSGGTGPFALKSWQNGDKVMLARNTAYWKQDKPLLDGIEVLVVPDASALSVYIETKAIHIAERVAPNDLKRLETNKDLDVVITAYGSLVDDIIMNVKAPPFDSPKVRAAINMAIDRNRFARNYYAGYSQGTCLPYPKNSPGYFADQAGRCEYDLDKARRLLQEAGVTSVQATFNTNRKGNPSGSVLAQIVQADLAKIGVTLKIVDNDDAVMRNLIQSKKYEISVHGYGRGNKDPLTMLTTAVVWLPNCEQNKTNYCSDKFTQLVEVAQTTIDPEKRKPILREINELLLSENFTLPIAPNFVAYVKQKGVQGFQANLDGMPIYDDIWIA
jgi:peptide/nickel transport system substrate-binding protein